MPVRLNCSHCNLALKRPHLPKATAHLPRPPWLRSQNKIKPLHIDSTLPLTWHISVARAFWLEAAWLQFLFVYLNYVSALIIMEFGADLVEGGQGTEAEGQKWQKGRGKVYLINQQQFSRSTSGDCYNILGIVAQAVHLIFPPLSKDRAEPNIALKNQYTLGNCLQALDKCCHKRNS